MEQLFIGEVSLSDGTIESVLLLEAAARIEFRTWDGSKAVFRFKGVIGVQDRNSAGQEVESLITEEIPLIPGSPGFLTELLEERPEGRAQGITRYAFIGSWTMRPVLEIFAEEVESERMYGF
ncbi:hypothetical protein [Saccharibacillus alkalitolerans]|uniref:Uncharacterized protein n=1 Tax=Saccharibacillus alkalitolerans TaxID=2705290 RepID=A0ABX0FCL8_9BACL|nr:hypothetical protein [Saccharibacillus alkalitolerans]NGZ78175.1 hypothetical protein [Saccharibacillus alkalitolerans]